MREIWGERMENLVGLYRVGRKVGSWDILRRVGISRALRTSAHGLCGWKRHLGHGRLADLGPRVDYAGNEANKDGRDTTEGDWSIEEDETTEGNWELIESTNHGVGGG